MFGGPNYTYFGTFRLCHIPRSGSSKIRQKSHGFLDDSWWSKVNTMATSDGHPTPNGPNATRAPVKATWAVSSTLRAKLWKTWRRPWNGESRERWERCLQDVYSLFPGFMCIRCICLSTHCFRMLICMYIYIYIYSTSSKFRCEKTTLKVDHFPDGEAFLLSISFC